MIVILLVALFCLFIGYILGCLTTALQYFRMLRDGVLEFNLEKLYAHFGWHFDGPSKRHTDWDHYDNSDCFLKG